MAAAFRKEAKLLLAAPQIRIAASNTTTNSASTPVSARESNAVANGMASQVWVEPSAGRRSWGLWKIGIGMGTGLLAITLAVAGGVWPRVKAWTAQAPKPAEPSST